MLLKIFENSDRFKQVLAALGRRVDMPVYAAGLSGVHKALLAAAVMEKSGRPVLLVTPDEASATRAAEDMAELLGADAVALLPARDLALRSVEGASREFEHARLRVLGRLLSGGCKAVACSVESALQYTLPPGTYKYNTLTLSSGGEADLAKLTERLVRAGYERRAEVDGVCQFSVRGGILDFYSPQAAAPVRVEFWGDSIDSMAAFDLETQRRTQELDSAEIAPAREVLADSAQALISMLKDARAAVRGKNAPLIKRNIDLDIERLDAGLAVSAPDRYLPLCYSFPATVFDYMPEAVVFVSEYVKQKEALRSLSAQWNEDASVLLEEGVLFPGCDKFAMDAEEYISALSDGDTVLTDMFMRTVAELPIRTAVDFSAAQLALWTGELATLCEDLTEYLDRGFAVAVLAGTQRGAKALTDDLVRDGYPAAYAADCRFEPRTVTVLAGFLSSGAEFPLEKAAVLSHSRTAQTGGKRRKIKKAENPLKSLSDLSVGDHVVHVTHGIGIFDGIVKRDIHGVVKDYIAIRYAGTDMLYVPVTQMDMVSKYIGATDDGHVKLSRLNSVDWQRTRSRVKAAVKDMAKELIALYSKRLSTPGFAFSEDCDWQRDFEERFPYDETDDQLRCVEEIKRDMEAPRPMERLLCGDVGFGKTEVAVRAAFKCVMDSKQVAVLVPTTILAFQHFQTFSQRFEGFPVTVELLSRFRNAKQQASVLKRLKTGEIDIVIGTHKLLQKDVVFKDLGLCVIDEEQRFGVAHKEKFKELKASVDVLTLSATPIPRTLNMAMSGIRDMSSIEEAPQDRHPVQTYVMEYDRGVVLEAIRKELRRGGQVFYLHNRIESIISCAARLQNDLPDARIVYAHGRMSEEELSAVWQGMIDHETDILVSTTIIENGIDLPSCNTMIVEDSDRLGLSQLYQLRGRVGRSSRRAFAYFTFTRGKSISDVAEKRLSAIRDFTQFGSGVKIALRDLEIRGAGNILGSSQHGHMESVGYEMYLRLLSEAVAEEKGEAPPADATDCTVDIQLDAHIPEKYIGSLGARVDVYKRIAAIQSEEDARDVLDELLDRFGEPPAAVLGLVEVATLRNVASSLGVTDIKQNEHELRFFLRDIDLERISSASGKMRGRLAVNVGDRPYLSITLRPGEQPLTMIKLVLIAMQDKANSK